MVFSRIDVVRLAHDIFDQEERAHVRAVARKLKYFSPETDYKALERELVSASSGSEPDDEIDYEELAAKYAVDDDDWDEDGK